MDRDADAVMHGSSFLQATHCTTYGRQRDARLDSVVLADKPWLKIPLADLL